MVPSEQELSDQKLAEMAAQLGRVLSRQGLMLGLAESCTGGWLAKIITDLPGSSSWFTGSVVCYSNESKHSLLSVKESTLIENGAVSSQTVLELAEGLFQRTNADVVACVSGIAGPGGGSEEKPVGLVWLSWGKRGEPVFATPYNFDGDRDSVRRCSIAQAFKNLTELLEEA